MKKIISLILLIIVILTMSGCSNFTKEQNSNGENKQMPIEVKENSVLQVTYKTSNGDFKAGTAFALTINDGEEPLLITAHHIFGEAGGLEKLLSGKELFEFVKGGKVQDLYTLKDTNASIEKDIQIDVANAIPNISGDIAAFKMNNTQSLNPLKLSDDDVKVGDKIHIFARLGNENQKIYDGTIVKSDDTSIYYKLNYTGSYNGSSGAPIVNENGQVVGMNLGSTDIEGQKIGIGHKSKHFIKLIEEYYK